MATEKKPDEKVKVEVETKPEQPEQTEIEVKQTVCQCELCRYNRGEINIKFD